MPFLRQSTIQTIRFGPFLDSSDGVTEEVALTITQALRRISKDGGAFAQSGETGNSTHDSDGWYFDDLTAADTNTVGELILNVQDPATHLPVWMRWWVLEEDIYDAIYGASANLVNSSGHVARVVLADTVTTNTDMRGTDNAALAAVLGALADVAAAGDPTSADTVMQYLKQVVNTLEGTAGIPTFPAEAAPGNNVSMVEVLRAIHVDVTGLNGDAMLTAAAVNAEMVDVLKTDTITLPGQAAPPATPTFEEVLAWLYKTYRNKKNQNATLWQLYDDAGTTVDSKATVSDAAGLTTKEEIVSGP